MSSRGLPGFLRRSRRWNDFEDDDNDDNDVVLENGKDNNKNTKQQLQLQQQQQQQQQQNQDQKKEQTRKKEPSLLLNASLQFLDPSSLVVSSAQEDVNAACAGTGTTPDSTGNGKDDDDNHDDSNHNNDNHSLSTIGDFDPTVVDTPQHQLRNASRSLSDASYYSSKIGYREAQFEKVLSNNVVKLSELRKIGWNGIPVGCKCYVCEFSCVFFCPG
jgi:type II secretory pathway pseudopilin PulG